jgi:hypothetical protein
VYRHVDTTVEVAEVAEQRECCYAGCVAGGVEGELAVCSGYLGDAQATLLAKPDDNFVAWPFYSHAKYVETNADVANRSGGEYFYSWVHSGSF